MCFSISLITAWFSWCSGPEVHIEHFVQHPAGLYSRDVKCHRLSPQSMYSALPGLLDGNPFSEGGQLRVPDGLSGILDVLKEALKLLTAFQVHPDISLQLCTYLFFFINASLFNALMERGNTESYWLWWSSYFCTFKWTVSTNIG